MRYHDSMDGVAAERIGTVGMVGDDPASDICGADACGSRYGAEWKGVLGGEWGL